MNINKFDISIMLVMSIAIVIMSFVFPALGMTGENAQESDLPEFNLSQTRFDFAGEFPQRRGQQLEGTLNHSSTNLDEYKGNIQYEVGKNSDGNRTYLTASNETYVGIFDVDATGEGEMDAHNFTSEGEEITLDGGGFLVDVRSQDLTHGVYDYEVVRRPETGGLFSLGGDVAATLGWLVSIVFWPFATIIEIFANVFGIMFDAISFFILLFGWLLGRYSSIVTGAPAAWASVFVALPGILLAAEFGKIVVIAVDVLWVG